VNTYVDSQCTQAITSQTSPLSQSNCKNGVQNTCGGPNQPPDPNQPSESGSETGPCSQDDNSPTSAGNDDDGPGKQPATPDYAVTHTIVLQGVTVSQFNSDPLIVKSFRQAIAVLLDVPTTDIINIVAQQPKSSRRVLRDPIVQRRNLEKSSCR
jgi:hypothetical protein